MITNADLTLYNKYYDPNTKAESYQRALIVGVVWENRKAANVLKSELISADQVAIYIPFARGANYLQPIAWQALTNKAGKWTLQVGDFVVKGIVTDTISGAFTITDLKAKYNDVLSIKSVDTMDRGNARMQHWQIGAS